MTPVRYALLSLFDKTGLVDLADGLLANNFTLLSTGGTAKALREHQRPVTDVSALTQVPEMLDGRVKTLHPSIHGGLLAKRHDENHQKAIIQHNLPSIDLLAVNLYPFQKTRDSGACFDDVVEMVDIGGPAMIRSAAKNHADVIVLTDPNDYKDVLQAIADDAVDGDMRKKLAARAFAHTASYDSAIAEWLHAQTSAKTDDAWPRSLTLSLQHNMTLRYGENPHQQAALYVHDKTINAPARAKLASGKPLSYNNVLDADAAFRLVSDFTDHNQAIVAIIKHANPCGIALGHSVEDAYKKAVACDPTSAFGGIIATNQPLDAMAANAMLSQFVEVIIAPSAEADVIALFSKKPNVRLLLTGMPQARVKPLQHREVLGGFLVQHEDEGEDDPSTFQVVSTRQPTDSEFHDLVFAWKVVRHVKSNALVFARNAQSLAIGAGQMSRLDSARIACIKAKEAWGRDDALSSAVMASDAFFPFVDTLEVAAEAGVKAVIQPGGSLRDEEVIKRANALGIAMVMTGKRHFRH